MLSRWHSHTMQALANRGGGGIPTRGLVYWHPLSEALSVLPTGQAVAQTGTWTYGTVSGVPCATKSNGNASIACTDGTGIPVGAADRSLSVWICATQSRAIDVCGWGGTAVNNSWRYKVATGSAILMPPQNLNAYAMAIGAWHHYAATYSGGITRWYVDGLPSGEPLERTLDTAAVDSTYPVFIGAASWQYGFRVASVRIYARMLSSGEIAALAAEHAPDYS